MPKQLILLTSLLLWFGLNGAVFAQPVPVGTLENPDSEFINEEFCYTATFTLTGDPGYGPYFRVMVPPGMTISGMQFLNGALSYTKVGAFPSGDVKLEDPISQDTVRAADGAVAGDTLFIATLPIGSVVSTTPELTVTICGAFNDEATLDSNYTFTIQPALQFGDTPTGTNGAIYGTSSTDQTKPVLVMFTKDNDAPEGERPPGPSWDYTYTLSLDVANAKTLTGLTFTDVLPPDVTWVGGLSISGGVGCSANYTPGTRTVSATCTSVTGTTSGEINLSFDVHVNDILDENTCTRDEITNSAHFTATYESTLVEPDSARDTLEVEHLSLQTGVSPSEILPGDTVTYTSAFQITDFDSASASLNPVSALSVEVILPGGMSYDDSFTPTIALSGGTTLGATSITPTVDTLSGDTVRLTFDVQGTTGNISGGTAGTLTYKALVRQTYDFAGSDPILGRDQLSASTVATYSLQGKASNCTDNSSAQVEVETMQPALTVENTPDNGVCWVPRETVTFKLTLTVNSGDTEGIIFQNFFPLPVFDVSELDTDNFGTGFDIRLASDHSDISFVPLTTNITKDASQNSLQIVWPDLDGPTETKVLSVLVDLPIDYQPFDDGLLLSDIFRYETQNSEGETVDSLLIRYLSICAPDVELYMGISATNGDGILNPDPVGNPVESSLSEVDAGDEVTFELTAINTGGARAYDIIVKDPDTEGLTTCDTIATNPVVYGDGTAVPAAGYSGSPFDAGGLVLDSLFENGDASSRDTIRIRCTCTMKSDLPADTTLFNQGNGQWRSAPVAEEPTASLFDLVTDSVEISSDRPSLSLSLTGISPNGSASGSVVVPGDTLTYTATLTLAEGETPSLVLSDTLPEGFAYVTGSVTVESGSFAGSVSGSPAVATSGTGASGSPQTVDFSFGNTTTTDNNNNSDNSFTVSFNVVALDNAANSGAGSLQTKTVESELTYDNQTTPAITSTTDVSLGEPEVAITTTLTPSTTVDAGDAITVTITITNNGTAPLYDATVTDNLDGLDDFFDLTSVVNTTASMGDWSFNQTVSTVTYSLSGGDSLAAGESQVFTFTANLDDNVLPRTTYQNEASVSGDGAPGSPPEQRTTSDNASDNLTTSDPSISKTLTAVSPDGSDGGLSTVVAGDTLTYEVTVTLTEGTTTDLVVSDLMPGGWIYSSYTVNTTGFNGTVSSSPSVNTSGAVNTGQTIDFTFSGNTTVVSDNNLTNNAFILEIIAVAGDNGGNDGTPLETNTNTVTLTSSSISATDITATHDVDFAEPRVTINKWIDQDTLDAGDTLTIELRVNNNNGTSMAHEVVAFDTLDSDLFDLNSVVLVNANDFTYAYDNVNGVVTFSKDTFAAGAPRVDLEFKAVIKAGVITGSTFENIGYVTSSSQTGTPPEEDTQNRDDTEQIYTSGVPSLTKSLIGTTDVNTSLTEAGIGEILTYQIAVTFPEGQTLENGADPLITDTLPIGFQYISSPSQSAMISAVADYNGGEITTSIAGTINGTPTSITPTVSGTAATGQVLGFDLGDITNNDNLVTNDTDDEQIIITFEVLVLNTSDNNAGDTKDAIVALQYQDGAGNPLSDQDTASLTVQEPDLALTTTAAPVASGAAGMTTVTFTTYLINQNSANSTTGYNLTFTDNLPDGFLGTGAGANAPSLTSATYTGDGSSIASCFEWGGDGNELSFDATNGGCTLDSLNAGDSIILVYTAVIDSLATFNDTLINAPGLQITSLTGAAGNTSSGGYTAGTAEGDEGERTGSGNANTSAQNVNDLSASAADSVILNEPSVTKSGDTDIAIGDSATLTITLTIPGGTGNSFIVTDDIPTGLRYTAESTVITVPAGVFADTPEPTTSADDDPIVWNFGTLTNHNSTPATLTITYEVESQNILANQDGTGVTGETALTFTGSSGADSLSDDATLTIAEPNLTLEVEDGGGVYGAGSTIPYTLRIINAAQGATAYGVNWASILPAELLGGTSPFYDNLVVTNTGGSVVLTGTSTAVAVGNLSQGTSVNTGDQLSLPAFDIPSGDTLLITFDATVINTATAGGSFDVNVSADYNSLLNDDTRGRDNSSAGINDDDNDADLNNYEESGSTTTVLTAAVTITGELNSIHADNDFTIGDSVWYDFKIALPEGIINSVVVVDSLPDGLGFLGATRTGGASMAFSAALSDDGVVGNAGKITFDLSNVTNTADGDASNDTLLLTVQALVLDDATNNIAGNTRNNEASVTSSVNPSGASSNVVAIEIIEPALSVSITPSNPSPSLSEEVTFTVTVNNTGLAIAHDIGLAALLRDLDLTYSGNFDANGSGFSIDAANPDSLHFSANEVAASTTVSFTFGATVDNVATLDSVQTVALGLTNSYSSQDGTPTSPFVERVYDVSETTVITPTLHELDVTKTVSYTDANANDELDPGETVSYSIIITNNTGNPATNVTLLDVLPDPLTYTGSSLATTTGTTDDGNAPRLLVDVGTIAAGVSDTITFDATVNGGLPDGLLISNQGIVDADQIEPEPTDVDGVDENGDQPTDILVGAQPARTQPLYAQKIVSWQTDTDADDEVTDGDIMRYSFILENRGADTLNNVSLTDAIPTGLSFSAAGVPSEGTFATGSYPNISWTGITLAPGEIATVTLDVSIDAISGADETFINQGTADSDETSSVSTDGNGSFLDGNQATTFTAVNSASAAVSLDLEKRWQQIADADGDGQIDPTDTYRYTLTLRNTGTAPATNVQLTDTVPTNTVLTGDSVVTSQGAVISETATSIQVNLGTIPPAGIATVSFTVTPSGASDGDLIDNIAYATSPDVNSGTAVQSDDNGLDDDGLNATRTPIHTDGGDLDASDITQTLEATSETGSTGTDVLIGEVLTYEIEVTIPKGYTYDAAIIDTLPPGLRYVAGTARLNRTFTTGLSASENPASVNTASSGSNVVLTDNINLTIVGDTAISLWLGDVINSDSDGGDETYTLQVQAVVANESGIGNDAGATLASAPDLSYITGINRRNNFETSTPPSVSIHEPQVTVVHESSSDWILAEGGTIEYTFTLANASGGNVATAYDVILRDSLPFDADEWESVSLTSTSTTGNAGTLTNNSNLGAGRLDFTVDSIPAGDSVIITIRATADGIPELTTETDSMDQTVYVTLTSLPGANGTGDATPGSPGDVNGERTSTGTYPDADYLDTTLPNLEVRDIDIIESILSAQSSYTIGDTVTYQVEITVPDQVTVGGNEIEVTLPNGISYISNSLITVSGNDYPSAIVTDPASDFTLASSGPDTLTLSLGSISNTSGSPDTIVLTYYGRIDNEVGNQYNPDTGNGTDLEDEAFWNFQNPIHPDAAFDDEINDSVSVEVGEPYLDVVYTIVSGDSTPGGTLNFQVVVSNTGNHAAYDLEMDDPVTTHLENFTSLAVSGTSGGATGPSGFTNNGTSWSAADVTLPPSSSITITFSADISSSAPYGASVTNTIDLQYSGQAGTGSAVERGFTDGSDQDDDGTLNNYNLAVQPSSDLVVVPIELLSFDANWYQGKQWDAEIQWQTATELNNAGFEVYRSWDMAQWFRIGQLAGAGTTQEPQNYRILDRGVGLEMPGEQVFYRLKQVDLDGGVSWSPTVSLLRISTEANLRVWPNPFEGTVNFQLSGNDQMTQIIITDAAGRKVDARRLHHNTSLYTWDRLETLTEGLYYFRVLTASGKTHVVKLNRR